MSDAPVTAERLDRTIADLVDLDPADDGSMIISDRERSEILTALRDYRRLREWQPIATAPTNGTCILLACNVGGNKQRVARGHFSTDPYVRGGERVIGAEYGFKCDGDECIPSNQEYFTHWMPLPPPPVQP